MTVKKEILLAALMLNYSACTVSAPFEGEYSCVEILGDAASPPVPVIEYVLKVAGDRCEITANGFQTQESIKCSAVEKDGRLLINYRSYHDGSTKNAYGVSVYKNEESLLSIERDDQKLLTRWSAMWPGEPVSRVDNCFTKLSP